VKNLFALGQTRAEVASSSGVSWRAAHGWYQRWREGGAQALHGTRKPGPAPKFDQGHISVLEVELRRGAQAHGYENALWTIKRVKRLIKDQLGLQCSESETWRLLRRMRWSPQKPTRRARERKEDKIKQWKERRWPQIVGEAKAEGRTIVFVDESGLSQKPARKSTWAPETQTPVLEFNFAWKKLSVIGGLTLRSIYFQLHESSIKSAQACGFIDHLRRHIGQPLLIVWDGLRAHWSKEVKAHLDSLQGSVRLEQLPAYAPELNPIEYLWGYIKGNDLANVCAKDLAELNAAARKAITRTRKIKSHLRAFWLQSELDLSSL
jgi:transposase